MDTLLVGHRGAAGSRPENTEVSILRAIELGVQWVEVDIQPTKDGVLVVCHDHTVDRCSDGEGRVDSLTLSGLKSLDFGGWFDPKYSNERILTLDELLVLAKKHKLCLNLEVKVDHHDPLPIAKTLTRQLDQSGLGHDQFILSSFSHETMRALSEHCHRYPLGLITEKLTDADRKMLAEIAAFSCHINYQSVTTAEIDELHQSGIQVWCYTVNKAEKFGLMPLVDAVFTDYPERF